MTVPEALADPRLRRFPLRRLRLPVAGGNLSLVVPDAAAWRRRGGGIDQILAGDEPPYWAEVWPASIAVARLLSRSTLGPGSSVVDLGCGVGVAAAAAARRGASVRALDRDPHALAFADFNGRQNAVDGGGVQCQRFDWRQDRPPADAHLWLLCDVTYRAEHHAPLLRLLDAGLGSGVAIHADPERAASESFLAACARRFAMHTQTVTTFAAGARVPIRLALVAHAAAPLQTWRACLAARPQPCGAPVA